MITKFSKTQLELFNKCQMQYKFQYIDNIKVPASGDLLRGDAYHTALAHAYTNVVIYKEMPPLQEILDVYSSTWEKGLNKRVIIDEDMAINVPFIDFGKDDPGKMKDAGIELLKIYYNKVLPKIQPAEVEVTRTCIYEGITITYRADLIDRYGVVIGHKFSEKSYSETDLIKNMEASVCGIVLGYDHDYFFNIHQALATKKPDINIIPIKRTQEDMDWVGKMIVSAWNQIHAGYFHPSPAGWWCSQSFCKYWGYCRIQKDF